MPFVAGSPAATAPVDIDPGNGGLLVLQPATTLEEFRTRWNEMAARSAASDPFGIFRLDPATGEDGIRIDWPDEHMTLDVTFDPATSLVRTIALTRSPGSQDRDAFIHVMAVLIAVSTPGQSLEQRVALYGRLGDASAAAGGGPFRFSVVDGAPCAPLTLMSVGHGDKTLTVGAARGRRTRIEIVIWTCAVPSADGQSPAAWRFRRLNGPNAYAHRR